MTGRNGDDTLREVDAEIGQLVEKPKVPSYTKIFGDFALLCACALLGLYLSRYRDPLLSWIQGSLPF